MQINLQNIDICQAGDDDKVLWDSYITNHDDSLGYHLFAWKLAVEVSYGFNCPYFFAKKDRRVYGVLPTVHIHPPVGKGKLVSLPYCDVGGILADTPEIAEILLKYACQFAQKYKIPSIEIRYSSNLFSNEDSGHPNVSSNSYQYINSENSIFKKVRMLLKLPESSDALLSSFKSKLRSQLKRPGKAGLTFEIGGAKLIDHFYSVFSENMRDLGSPVHSKNWLRNVLKYYGEKAKCGIVYMPDKTPVAAGIILCHDRIVSIPWASSLKRFNRFSPNMLLYWSFLEFSANNGYLFFDFGRSTPGEGTYKFKAQWGASPQTLHWERLEIGRKRFHPIRSKITPNSNDRSRVMAEKIIQKMPLPLAIFLGSRLRKYIPL